MKELRNLVREIQKGRCNRNVWERYREKALQVYTDYAALELTFSAYTLREELRGEKGEPERREPTMTARLWRALEELCSMSYDRDSLIRDLKELRQEITEKMDRFTAYIDQLICYEYVLNHMELKFLSEKELEQRLAAMDEEWFIRQIMWYLFGKEDQSVIKEKIHVVMGQVPARMTRTKLYEKIGEALSLYQGGDRSALDDFLYMLRTSAMIYEPAGVSGDYPDFERGLARLSQADYSRMTETEYLAMAELLEVEVKAVHEITDFYYSMQEVVNDLYALCLLSSYKEGKGHIYETCLSIWRALLEDGYRDEMLVSLEGEIEDRVEASGYLESVLFEMEPMISGEQDRMDFLSDLTAVVNLLSDSLFVDIDRSREEETADNAYIKEREAEFLSDLSARLDGAPRPLRRAITSQILEKLPVFFKSSKEVEEYIRVNLLGCQDKAERCIVMEILLDLAREEQEWS